MPVLVNEKGETLDEFLKKYHAKPKAYPKAALTADLAIFRWVGDALQVLAIQRKNHPCLGQWALPGGFFDVLTDESLEACGHRELKEETGLDGLELFPLGVYSRKGRDPRDRVVSQLFVSIWGVGLIPGSDAQPVAGDDAADAKWMDFSVAWEEDKTTFDEKRCRIALRNERGIVAGEQTLKVRDRMIQSGHDRDVIKRDVSSVGNGTLAFDHGEMLLEAYTWLTGQQG
jgi:8-oxo-dGTP diphosphatase